MISDWYTALSYFFFAVVAVAVGAVVVLAIRKHRKDKRILRGLSDAIGATRSGDVMTATYQGTKYYCHYFAGSKNSPSYFMVGISSSSPGEFEISKEGRTDRFFKDVGLSSEVQTGDPEFDREFYIISEQPGFAAAVFALPEKREAVREIFRLGFNSVKLEDKNLVAQWSPFALKEDREPSFIIGAVPPLARLGKDLPIMQPSISRVDTSGWKAKKRVAFAVPLVLLPLGIGLMMAGTRWYPALDEGKLFLESLRYSLPLLALFTWFAARIIKGRASSHKDFLSIFLISLFGFPASGFGTMVFLNGWLDLSPPTAHTVPVSRKYTTRSKNSTNYYVTVNSWRRAGEDEDLSVPRPFHERIGPGQATITVVTKPGRFGFEWIVEYRLGEAGRQWTYASYASLTLNPKITAQAGNKMSLQVSRSPLGGCCGCQMIQ